jgi:ABC-type dipeptide/oligopeptide/nickel transport system ATPase component/ABC-type dipeptide/oligopeptide/nickel transport system permease subunit
MFGLLILSIAGPAIWADEAGRSHLSEAAAGMSADHPVGTDDLGRDMLLRTVVATRLSLAIALSSIGIAATVGTTLGLLVSSLGRRAGLVGLRIIDLLLAFPPIISASMTTIALGPGVASVTIGVGLGYSPQFARLTAVLATTIQDREYVQAARMLRLPRRLILTKHVVPNIAGPITILAWSGLGSSLIAASSLSFLGLGVQSPTYDWGSLLGRAIPNIYTNSAVVVGPALGLVVAGVIFSVSGEALAKAVDPRGWSAPSTTRRTATRQTSEVTGPTDNLLADAGARFEQLPHRPQIEQEGAADPPAIDDPSLAISVSALRLERTADEAPLLDVSFGVEHGEFVALVGESGSGKTLTTLAVAGLLPPGVTQASGAIAVEGRAVSEEFYATREGRAFRRDTLGLIFQDPATSLNPALKVGRQLIEVARLSGATSRSEATQTAEAALSETRLPGPRRIMAMYPHELSGGMKQRIMIAMALLSRPSVLIADEPTTALDVTTQEAIIELLLDLRTRHHFSMVFVTHNLLLAAELCDRILVMHEGKIVENLRSDFLDRATVPYTQRLMAAVPRWPVVAGSRRSE